jgi:L-amino acid N-acyltransferase YncA
MSDTARAATPADARSIARIYNEGIAGRTATFETRPRTAAEIEPWFDGVHPVIVIERNGEVAAFASTSTYRPRDCYAGVAEFSVYVSGAARRTGAGRAAMEFLMREAARAGFWKLVSRVFPENIASLALLYSLGFRAVGTYYKHGQLEGRWRDVVIVEKLLSTAAF